MLDRLATLAHGLWVCIKALLHGLEQILMLRSRNPPLWPGRVMDSKIGPVRAQFLGGNGQVDGWQERVCGRAGL
jgi:hypothetical protein